MFSLIGIFSLLAVASAGILHPAPLIAPAVPAPLVTARSSQVIARNYNTFAAAPLAPVAAPIVAGPFSAPVVAAPYAAPAAFPAHPFAYTAPGFLPGPLVFKK